MADVTVTAVTLGSKTTRKLDTQFGETVAVGELVYKDGSTGKYKRTDADLSILAAATIGICIVGGALDDWGLIALEGLIGLTGSSLVIGDAYYASPQAGNIMPMIDLATGDWASFLGIAMTTTQLDLSIKNSLPQVP